MNKYQLRIETARRIFLACGSNIDKAMMHKRMPYKSKRTLQKLAREHKWYQEAGISEPWRKSRLKDEDIEDIHKSFIETRGNIRNTAQKVGFGRSTVSKYAKTRGWYDELHHINTEFLNREAGQNTEQVAVGLRTLRRMLFKEIIGYEDPSSIPYIKITPKTLSEAIKALLDIDKRISEHEGGLQVTILEQYQRILAGCAKIVEDEAE